MKLTPPWNIGITGESTVELSMANDVEARGIAKLFERKGIVCEIHGHWLLAESHWGTVLDVLRGLAPEPAPVAPESAAPSDSTRQSDSN